MSVTLETLVTALAEAVGSCSAEVDATAAATSSRWCEEDLNWEWTHDAPSQVMEAHTLKERGFERIENCTGGERNVADVVVEDPDRRVEHARRTGGEAESNRDGRSRTRRVARKNGGVRGHVPRRMRL